MIDANKKRIKEIKAEIKELEDNFNSGAMLDGEPMLTEAEYYMAMADLMDELRALQMGVE